MRPSRSCSLHGILFLHAADRDFVTGHRRWPGDYGWGVFGLVFEIGFLLVVAYAALTGQVSEQGSPNQWPYLAALLISLFLFIHTVNMWQELEKTFRLAKNGEIIRAEIVSIDFEEQSEGSALTIVNCSFESPTGKVVEGVGKGSSCYPSSDTEGIYVLYLNDEEHMAL